MGEVSIGYCPECHRQSLIIYKTRKGNLIAKVCGRITDGCTFVDGTPQTEHLKTAPETYKAYMATR
jgi:hypothetical protein